MWRHQARDHSTRRRPLATYWRSFGTKPLSPAIFEIMGTKHVGIMTLTFRVTWRHPSHDHLIPRCPFPIGSPSSSSLYLHQFPRYWALSIFGSRPWPFRVTWRRQSCDHSTCDGPFPIGGHLDPSLYLLTVSEIFCPKHYVLIDKMLNCHCTCAISHDMYPLCKI